MSDSSRRNQLVAAIRRSPDEPDGYHVLSDWLTESGDPMGPWIARLLRYPAPVESADLTADDCAYLVRHPDAILGRFAWWLHDPTGATSRAVRWRWGFFDALRIRARFRPVHHIVEDALAAPAAGLVRSLAVGDRSGQTPEVLDAVFRGDQPLLGLTFGETGAFHQEGVDRLLDSEDWGLHTLRVGGSASLQTFGWFVQRVANSELLGRLRVLMTPMIHASDDEIADALAPHADALRHLERLEIPRWYTPPPGPRPVREVLDNVRWRRASSLLVRRPTVGDYRAFEPAIHCPTCLTSIQRARLVRRRLTCPGCGEAFPPPDHVGSGHPGPISRPSRTAGGAR